MCKGYTEHEKSLELCDYYKSSLICYTQKVNMQFKYLHEPAAARTKNVAKVTGRAAFLLL